MVGGGAFILEVVAVAGADASLTVFVGESAPIQIGSEMEFAALGPAACAGAVVEGGAFVLGAEGGAAGADCGV